MTFVVNPDAHDSTTKQIQSKLGNYSLVKHLLVDEPKRLFGIEGVPASPAPRGGFVKPADSKPPHGGRGGYPGQPVKHGSSSNDHRSHGLIPAKGPPSGSSSSSSSVGMAGSNSGAAGQSSSGLTGGSSASMQRQMHTASVRLPKLSFDGVSSKFSTPELEHILKWMEGVHECLRYCPRVEIERAAPLSLLRTKTRLKKPSGVSQSIISQVRNHQDRQLYSVLGSFPLSSADEK
ncbi:hypothetical protein TSAR_013344 [Trichomalopsis sarcophagae]|uniref:Uncharacterized protein n=1 Tax=Trichomalopsis sarcophagae TaxID=543379 RepID=A0A232F9H3_9HYME|nr:hypothetical protein TSAR_013344 [Trichomalopsis sarcophagae]